MQSADTYRDQYLQKGESETASVALEEKQPFGHVQSGQRLALHQKYKPPASFIGIKIANIR